MTLGEAIRRIRLRHRKTQQEFADMLDSQRNSITRYEADKVAPGLNIVWKLYALAEPDEKNLFGEEIRRRIGTALLGQEATVGGTIEELRPLLETMAFAEKLRDMNPEGRTDLARLLHATFHLRESGDPIDDSVLDILDLWIAHRRDPRASVIFRAAASDVRRHFPRKE